MPLRKENTRNLHRTLFAGETQTITLLKRNDDQQEGTITSYIVYNCRRSQVFKEGQPVQGDMTVGQYTTWHIASEDLDTIGVNYISVLDRIVDKYGRFWQPETNQLINVKLFENEVDIVCVRVDPPVPPAQKAGTGI